MSFIYLIDMTRIFTSPYMNKNGKLETSYRLIFRRYASTWLIFDLYSFYPLGFLKYKSVYSDGSFDEVLNWKQQNFDRMPRLYKQMILPIIIARGRNAGEYFSLLLKSMSFMSIEVQNVTKTFSTLLIILHVTGCLWHLAPYYNLTDNNNWITENDLDNSSQFSKYMASLYWATVTCTTVGYGDILPVNYFELVLCLFIIVFGVAVFSYILSNLSS